MAYEHTMTTRGMARLLALAIGLSALTGPSGAEAQSTEEFQQWGALFANVGTTSGPPGFFFWADLHARRGDPSTILLIRPGVGFNITSWINVLAGYAWIPTFVDATGDASHEHRIWEQVVLKHRFQDIGLFIQSRTRFEQRFLATDEVALRIREFVRVNWQPTPDFPMGVAFWDEIFIGLTEQNGAPQGMDQNRVFLGPFLQMAPWARLEVGYLFVYADRATDLFAHVLAMNVFISPHPTEAPEPEPTPEDGLP